MAKHNAHGYALHFVTSLFVTRRTLQMSCCNVLPAQYIRRLLFNATDVAEVRYSVLSGRGAFVCKETMKGYGWDGGEGGGRGEKARLINALSTDIAA